MSLSKNSIVTLLAVMIVLGCASSRSSPAATRTSSPDYVTSIEIAGTTASNAYDLITRLRPRWLQPLPAGSLGSVRSQVIVVLVDGVRLGAQEGLRSISASAVKTMQYYDAARASTVLHEVGSEPIAGAIVITTTRIQ
jgi:hypothetical protein